MSPQVYQALDKRGAPMDSRDFIAQEPKAKKRCKGKVIASDQRCCAVEFLPFTQATAAEPGLAVNNW